MSYEPRATPQELEHAKAELARLDESWASDTSGNPDKHFARRQAARRRVRALTAQLKAQGDLPMTAHEQLCAAIDAEHPNARSGEIVEHAGQRYRRRFFPVEKSRSGKTVTEWGRTWEAV